MAFGSISLIACLILKLVPEDKFCSKIDKSNKVIPMETNNRLSVEYIINK